MASSACGERVERLGAPPVLQRGGGAGHRGLEGLGGHGESIAARREARRAGPHRGATPAGAYNHRDGRDLVRG